MDEDRRKVASLYAKEWRKAHPNYLKKWKDKHPGYFVEYTQAIKREVLTYYGNGQLACVFCGFEDIKALSIDHINSKGNSHRKQIGKSTGANFYMWLKKNDYPLGYRTLCMNCQYLTRGN